MFAHISDDVLMESVLWKRSKKGKKEHYYRLYKDRLERYESAVGEVANKILILRGVKSEFLNIADDPDFKETHDKYIFIFTLN